MDSLMRLSLTCENKATIVHPAQGRILDLNHDKITPPPGNPGVGMSDKALSRFYTLTPDRDIALPDGSFVYRPVNWQRIYRQGL